MAHWNSGFTQLHSMVIFHSFLHVYQWIILNHTNGLTVPQRTRQFTQVSSRGTGSHVDLHQDGRMIRRNWVLPSKLGTILTMKLFFHVFSRKKTWHSSRDTGSIRFRKPLNLGGPLFSDKPVWVSTQSPSSKGQLWHVNEWNPQSCWRTKKNVIAELEVPLSVGFKWKVNM